MQNNPQDLYNKLISQKTDSDKFNLLKTKTQDELEELSQYILKNFYRVREKKSTDINSTYSHIVKAMIYQSLDGLQNDQTLDQIKEKLNFLKDIKDQKIKAGIEKSMKVLAKKIHARCQNEQTPQNVFEEIAKNNPGWFMEIIHFLARCLFISTEYNAMREYNKQIQNAAQHLTLIEKQKDIILDASEFDASSEDAQIQSGSVHPIKKFTRDDDTWFEKGHQTWGDMWHTFRHAIIKDHKAREVLAAAILKKMMGKDNTTEYKLKRDKNGNLTVVSKGVKYDDAADDSGKLTLQKFLMDQEKDQYFQIKDLRDRQVLGNKIKDKLKEKMNSKKDFAEDFIKLHCWNYILGNPDLHCGNIMMNNNDKMIPIDFGLALNDASKLTPEQSANVLNANEISWLNKHFLFIRGHQSIIVAETVRDDVIRKVLDEFNNKKEEISECIEDTCFALGIGKHQTKLVIDALEKNAKRLEKLLGSEQQNTI